MCPGSPHRRLPRRALSPVNTSTIYCYQVRENSIFFSESYDELTVCQSGWDSPREEDCAVETTQAVSRLPLKDEDLCGPQHASETAGTNVGACTSQCCAGRDRGDSWRALLTQPGSSVSELQFQWETRSEKHSGILDLWLPHPYLLKCWETRTQGCGHRSMPGGHRYCLELVLRRHTLSHWACSQCLFHSLDLKTHIFLKGKLLVNTSFGKQKHTHFLKKSAFWYLCFATNITIIWKSPSGISSFRTGFVLCTYLNLPSCEVVWADPLQRVI